MKCLSQNIYITKTSDDVILVKEELRPSEAIYHKIHHKILRLLQKKNELAAFQSLDEIRKKLREPQV